VNHGNAQSNNPQQRAKRLEFDRFKAEATMVDVVNVGDNDELPSPPSPLGQLRERGNFYEEKIVYFFFVS
jgi:hypothetical protein